MAIEIPTSCGSAIEIGTSYDYDDMAVHNLYIKAPASAEHEGRTLLTPTQALWIASALLQGVKDMMVAGMIPGTGDLPGA